MYIYIYLCCNYSNDHTFIKAYNSVSIQNHISTYYSRMVRISKTIIADFLVK